MSSIFALTQAAYRWYEDGTEAGGVALAAQSTAPTVNVFSGNVDLVLRVLLNETGAGSISGAATDDYQLQYSKNGGAFTNVTTSSSNAVAWASGNLTDGGATTQRLTGGGGSFVAGEVSEDGLVDDRQLTANNNTEHVYTVRFVSADLANGDVMTFRVLLNGATTNVTYTVTPTLNVVKVAPVSITPSRGALALAGALVAVAFAGPVTGGLAFQGYAPEVTVTGGTGTSITVPIGSVAFAGKLIGLAFDGPDTGGLAFQGYAPAVSVSGGGTNETVEPSRGALAFAGAAPSLAFDYRITPLVGALAYAGSAPSVTVSNHRIALPSVGVLAFAGQAPTLALETTRTPSSGALAFTGYAPTVTQVAPGTVVPSIGALSFAGLAPTLDFGLSVPRGALALAGQAPSVHVGAAIDLPVGSLAFAGYAPSVVVAMRVEPSVGGLAFSGAAPSPTIGGPAAMTVPVGTLAFAGMAPTVVVVNPSPPPYAKPRHQRETRVHALFGILDTTEGHMRRRG